MFTVDLDTAPPTWLTAVPTAPVWCERKLVEGGFQVSCIKNHHESISCTAATVAIALANKFTSHVYLVVTVCSC